MDFDYSHKPSSFPSEAFAKAYLAAREDARAAGLSVQFMKDDGTRDEWSFRDEKHRDAFTAKLGRQFVVSDRKA